MFSRILEWWRGEQIYPPPGEIDIDTLISGPVVGEKDESKYKYNRPLLRKIAEPIWTFCFRYWQFVISTIVAITLAVIFSG